jgi:hypothetical protein
MKHRLITIIVMLAIGLQGSAIAFAGAQLMQSDCQSTSSSQDAALNSCCPSGLHTASCCLDACIAAMAIAVSPLSLVWYGRAGSALQFRSTSFSSRGDSPLIRPPIL